MVQVVPSDLGRLPLVYLVGLGDQVVQYPPFLHSGQGDLDPLEDLCMEEEESSKHLVVQGIHAHQDPPLGQEIQIFLVLQAVLAPPLILENPELHRNQGYPEALGILECLSLLWFRYQVHPWVLVVLVVQSPQAFLLYPFLLYRDNNQVVVSIESVQESPAGLHHPGLPSALLLLRQDCPSNLGSQSGPASQWVPALLDSLWGLEGLSYP